VNAGDGCGGNEENMCDMSSPERRLRGGLRGSRRILEKSLPKEEPKEEEKIYITITVNGQKYSSDDYR
jgi:hypothetical protein